MKGKAFSGMMLSLLLISMLTLVFNIQQVKAEPKTIYVDASNIDDPLEDGTIDHPFDRIQEGIDAASSGDTVLVAAGTYYENIILKDGVRVQGAGADLTTIDGGAAACAVTATGVGPNTAVDGFTITNGRSWDRGGGVYIKNAELVVSNNVILDNIVTSPHMGGCGGIYSYYSSPVIRDNIVENNTGGAITIIYTSSATVTGNIVTGNEGGISVKGYLSSFANISNNIVSNNFGLDMYMIEIDTHSGVVSNNQVTANSRAGNFYSILVWSGSIIVSGNLVSDNHATDYGAGICIAGGSNATMKNNIIVGNSAQTNGGGFWRDTVCSSSDK